MPQITKYDHTLASSKTRRARGSNKAVAWLNEIMAAVAGSNSGEDALSVLNRKIEDSDIIGHGMTTPVPTASTPWIYFRTDAPKHFFLKERSGSPGSYTYSYLGPFFVGDYQIRIIYSAADTPATPTIGWNAFNQNFNISGGDWAVDTPAAKWFRIVGLPATSNTESLSPLIRIGDPNAEQISYTPSGSGNIHSAVDNVKEALDTFDTATLGGGGSITQQPADWDATSGPTRILNKPIVPQVEETDSPVYPQNPQALAGIGSISTFNFNIDQELLDFSSNYNENLFVEANAKITLQSGTQGTGNYAFDIRNGSGNTFTTPIAGAISI